MYAHICVYYLSVKSVKNDFIFTELPAGRTWSATEDINLMLIWFQLLKPPILRLPIRISWPDIHTENTLRGDVLVFTCDLTRCLHFYVFTKTTQTKLRIPERLQHVEHYRQKTLTSESQTGQPCCDTSPSFSQTQKSHLFARASLQICCSFVLPVAELWTCHFLSLLADSFIINAYEAVLILPITFTSLSKRFMYRFKTSTLIFLGRFEWRGRFDYKQCLVEARLGPI